MTEVLTRRLFAKIKKPCGFKTFDSHQAKPIRNTTHARLFTSKTKG